jgi:hypothetical protein
MLTDYWLVLFTISCFANMLGLNISSALNSAVTIYILIPFIIIPQLLLAGVVVKFDKLNPLMAEQGGVPVVGEMMASRWAYEALAVNQFKANKYEKNFYKFDKVISIAGFKKVYWIPKIEKVMTKIGTNLKENLKKSEIEADFTLIKNELLKEQKSLNNKYKFDGIEKLNAKDYTPEVAKSLKDFLAKINEHYINRENKYRGERDKLVQSMTKDSVAKANYMALEDDYTNDILE